MSKVLLVLAVLAATVVVFTVPFVVELAIHLGLYLSEKRRQFSCIHDWKILYEHAGEAPIKRIGARDVRGPAGMVEKMYMETCICIPSCSKCGAIDKTIGEV